MHVEKVATRASPNKLEAKMKTRNIRAKKTFDVLHAPARVTGKHGFAIHFFVSFVGPDEQQTVTKDCFISDGTAETRDSKRNAAKQHSMIPGCPDCPGVIYDKTVPFSVNLCLRPWTNVWVNEENYCVTVCGQSSVTSGENVRLCRFSIDTASLYLNNFFWRYLPSLTRDRKCFGCVGRLENTVLFCSMRPTL